MSAISNVTLLTGNAVVIALKLPDGKGDVAIGYDIYKLIQRIFTNLKIVFSYANPHPSRWDSEYEKMPKIALTAADEANWEVTNITQVYERIQMNDFKFIIINSASADLLMHPIIRHTKIPTIKLKEYGSPIVSNYLKPPVYTLGFTKKDKGVAFPHYLYQTYLKPADYVNITNETRVNSFSAKIIMDYCGYAQESAVARLQHLAALPRDLVNLIIGSPFDHPKFDKRAREFSVDSKLYYGYSHEGILFSFIRAICNLDKTPNITICLLGSMPEIFEFQIVNCSFMQALKIMQREFLEAGFKNIKVYTHDNEWTSKDLLIAPKNTRSLRIIFSSLPPLQADELAKASERETLTTGDSSFLKALALNKFTTYDMRPHKMDFINSFVALANRVSSVIGALLNNSIHGSNQGKINPSAMRNGDLICVGMLNFFNKMRNEDQLQRKWNAIIQEIVFNYDLGRHLPQIIQENVK